MKHLDLSVLSEDMIEECGIVSPNECVVNRIAEEYSNKPYSHELGKEDLEYISHGDWDLHKQ